MPSGAKLKYLCKGSKNIKKSYLADPFVVEIFERFSRPILNHTIRAFAYRQPKAKMADSFFAQNELFIPK